MKQNISALFLLLLFASCEQEETCTGDVLTESERFGSGYDSLYFWETYNKAEKQSPGNGHIMRSLYYYEPQMVGFPVDDDTVGYR